VTTLHADVVVLGDGPAGSVLAAECAARGMDTMLIGPGTPWPATYGAWLDDVPERLRAAFHATPVVAIGTEPHHLAPEYAVADNDALRRLIDVEGLRRIGVAEQVQHFTWGTRVQLGDGSVVNGAVVVDARGAAAVSGGAVQTAYGLVLDRRPDGIDGDYAVLMDWCQQGGPQPVDGDPTFLYVMPLAGDRWLVEETSLASASPPDATTLRARLAARLGSDLTDQAERVEHVVIPMTHGVPEAGQLVRFGAAAGYVHPATGYSITASWRMAPEVASALNRHGGDPPDERVRATQAAVWPRAMRTTRALHDYGLRSLLRLGPDAGAFFDAFFELPVDRWMPYLRIDAAPTDVARTMAAVFAAVPWAVRRKLLI
jgi:lycopene beta-cyclase